MSRVRSLIDILHNLINILSDEQWFFLLSFPCLASKLFRVIFLTTVAFYVSFTLLAIWLSQIAHEPLIAFCTGRGAFWCFYQYPILTLRQRRRLALIMWKHWKSSSSEHRLMRNFSTIRKLCTTLNPLFWYIFLSYLSHRQALAP